ncbi:MAG TPA: hypothetical protein VJL37_10445 [Flavobacterium sp.]|nr:hypothetical protein [Flavobacterium sp.]
MKTITSFLILFIHITSYAQESYKKPIQIQFERFLINKNTKEGNYRGRNPLSLLILEEKDLAKFKRNQSNGFNPKKCNLNFKVSLEGKFYFVKGSVGIKKTTVPEELKGIPEFDYEYYNDQELIDCLNEQFLKLNIKYVFVQNGIEMTNLAELSEITFADNFYFITK